MTNVQERFSAPIGMPANAVDSSGSQVPIAAGRSSILSRGDTIRRIAPQFSTPTSSTGCAFGSMGAGTPFGIISELLGVVAQLLSMFGLGGTSTQAYFKNANGASTGDPHLSFDGTNVSGANEQARFDSMIGHSDLLDSDSFAGGYQISTSVTQPAANGVTYNQQATISTGFGQTQVSLDNAGNATIVQNGQTTALADGESVDLGQGEAVTRAADGSVAVSDDNGFGGTITTTLSESGQGVNVNAQANDVDLGGDLLGGNQPQPSSPAPITNAPVERPIPVA